MTAAVPPAIPPVAPPPRGTSQFVATPAWQKLLTHRLVWPALTLVLLLLYNARFTENFFHIRVIDGHLYGSLIDVIAVGTPVAILAIGMTLVIATGGVDLSVGSTMAICGALAALFVTPQPTGYGWPFFAAAGVALTIALVVGAWNGVMVAVLRVQPIIATLIMMVAGRGIAQKIGDGQKLNFADPTYVSLANGYFLYMPLGLTLVAFVFVLVAASTRRTALGLALESVGDSPRASRYVGLRVNSITIAAYMICALCAGVAGFVDASRINSADPINSGVNKELDAIFAVVVGGTALTGGRFTLVGSILGAVLVQTLETTLLSTKMFGQDIKPEYLPLPKAVVILVVCLLQSPKFRAVVSAPFRRS